MKGAENCTHVNSVRMSMPINSDIAELLNLNQPNDQNDTEPKENAIVGKAANEDNLLESMQTANSNAKENSGFDWTPTV